MSAMSDHAPSDAGTTLAFLQHILPDEGFKCVAVFKGKHPNLGKPKQVWFTELPAMAQFCVDQDQLGLTVYHACSSFRTQSRKAQDSAGACCLWFDLDSGPDKPYATAQDAWNALNQFCLTVRLPSPTLVASSGYGIQGYWAFDEVLEPELWIRYAKGFKALCEQHQLHVDHSRTTDLASILRPPGTYNRKRSIPELVIAGEMSGPYALENFDVLLANEQLVSNVVSFPTGPSIAAAAMAGTRPRIDVNQTFPEGARDTECTKRIGKWFGGGFTPDEVLRKAHEWNKGNKPPLPDNQVVKCWQSIRDKEAKKHALNRILIPAAIQELNLKHFMVRDLGGKCMIGEWKQSPIDPNCQILGFQTPADFRTFYANSTIGDKPAGAIWTSHPQRLSYEGVELKPNAPAISETGYLNLWRGFGVEPRLGKWPRMMEHICHVLASGDRTSANYILRWLAWGVQNPAEQADVALVLMGEKGVGKGLLGKTMREIYGSHGLHIFSQLHLTGNFNAHFQLCVFMFSDEAFWAGDRKGEAILKGLITESTLMVTKKGVDAIQAPNRLKLLMAANADWVVPASHDERRYAVFLVSNNQKGDRRYFKALIDEKNNGGREAMLYDLLNWNLNGWHPRDDIPETEALRLQKAASLSPLEQWWESVLQEGKLPGGGVFNKGQSNLRATAQLREHAATASPMLKDLSSQKLATFLRHKGCFHRRDALARGWAFPTLKALRAEWVERYKNWPWDENLEEWT